MGIQNGRISLMRYKILNFDQLNFYKLNKEFRKYLSGEIKLKAFSEKEKIGWVQPLNLMHQDICEEDYWDLSNCQTSSGILLRMRIERRKVPSELLQALLKEQLDSLSKKNIKVSPTKKRELKENLSQTLLEKSLPSISNIDAFWNNNQTVSVYSHSSKTLELFEHLFTHSILKITGGNLIPYCPPIWNQKIHTTDELLKTIKKYSRLSMEEHI